MRIVTKLFVGAVVLLASAGCGGGMHRSGPPTFNTLVIRGTENTTVAEVVSQIRATTATMALLFVPRDSAWYADLAKQAGLVLSRSHKPALGSIAFLAVKPEGDTTVMLGVAGGKPMLLHDALYKADKERLIDLLGVRVEAGTSARETVHSLLTYMASDVQGDAAIVLAIEAPTPALSDSLSTLLRPVLLDAHDCMRDARGKPARAATDLLVFLRARGAHALLRCAWIERSREASFYAFDSALRNVPKASAGHLASSGVSWGTRPDQASGCSQAPTQTE